MDTKKYINDYVEKMVEAYNRNGSIILGYDFDDTVHSDKEFSSVYVYEVQRIIKEAYNTGAFRFILITCREGEALVSAEHYLHKQGLPYNSLNQNLPWSIPDDPRKIYCNLMLDDKCGLPTSLEILRGTIDRITEIQHFDGVRERLSKFIGDPDRNDDQYDESKGN